MDTRQKKRWKWRIWISVIILTAFIILLVWLEESSSMILDYISILNTLYLVLGVMIVILIPINIAFFTKFYNWIPYFVGLILIGISLKVLRFADAYSIIFIGSYLLSIVSLFAIFIFLLDKDMPIYLKRFGAASSFLVFFVAISSFFVVLHIPGAAYMDYAGVFLLIVLLLAFVFTLPNSKYIDWTKLDKKIFFRALIIPLAFLFVFTVILKLVPNVFNSMDNVKSESPFKMIDYELQSKEGLQE